MGMAGHKSWSTRKIPEESSDQVDHTITWNTQHTICKMGIDQTYK